MTDSAPDTSIVVPQDDTESLEQTGGKVGNTLPKDTEPARPVDGARLRAAGGVATKRPFKPRALVVEGQQAQGN